MNKLLENLYVRDKHNHRLDDFTPLTVSCTEKNLGSFMGDSRQNEYQLVFEIAQTFYANSAQYESVKEAALRSMAAFIYADVRMQLERMRFAISSGSRDEAMQTWKDLFSTVIP